MELNVNKKKTYFFVILVQAESNCALESQHKICLNPIISAVVNSYYLLAKLENIIQCFSNLKQVTEYFFRGKTFPCCCIEKR